MLEPLKSDQRVCCVERIRGRAFLSRESDIVGIGGFRVDGEPRSCFSRVDRMPWVREYAETDDGPG